MVQKTLEHFLKERHPSITWTSAQAVLELTKAGGTVPFIARYRKEQTKNLDEVAIRAVIDGSEEYETLLQRKEFVLKEVAEQGNLTEDLKNRIESSWSLAEVEELYRPFKKKKKTKATLAREAGIEPFADWIWWLGQEQDFAQSETTTLEVKAKEFTNVEHKFATYEEVLRGAQNILIERIYNNPDLRAQVRQELYNEGRVTSKPGKKVKANSKFEMYFEFSEAVPSLMQRKASHRYLALRRGWAEGELAVTVEGDQEKLQSHFNNFACPVTASPAKSFLEAAAKSALTVHVMPSITNEIHRELKENADSFAIDVFAGNVQKVLLSSPYGPKCILGVDPGVRTGCKIALVDNKGQFLSHTVLHLQGNDADDKAKKLFEDVFKQIEIEAIAVGNGTGGREAEVFLRKTLKELGKEVPVILISEAGASIYSASDVAREEFPDLDLTVRGAISIARRLQDPLSELVKIEPKSIGVGQYQHDVSQTTLKKRLDHVVESCVNTVGVDVNTASERLLQYVAGIGPAVAKNIVAYRKEKGLFGNRDELTKVPSFSTKTFEQAAGFLRVKGDTPLDATGVHPERYSAVKDMTKELNLTVKEVMGNGAAQLKSLKEKWQKLIGEFTFDDIVEELSKPGRDPRAEFQVFKFRDDISALKDVKPDMVCSGIVTNVTNFGAFVDIGVHQDGLVHISELGNQFVEDPQKVVSPGDQVQVKVKSVDLDKNQLALSMKLKEEPKSKTSGKRTSKASGKKTGKNFKSGKGKPGGKGGQRGGQRGGGQRDPRRGGQPFNNPFASLGNLKD